MPPHTMPVWSLAEEDALAAMQAERGGLTESASAERRKRFGENTLPQTRHFTVLGILAKQFASPLIFILLGAAVLTVFLHEWVNTAVIILAILVNAGLGFVQEYRAENSLEKLTTYIRHRARVVRDGLEQEIDSSLLVPGDIIRIAYGVRVPADGRILEEHNLSVDESVLTGESLPVQKNTAIVSEGTALAERANMAHAGTLVVEGAATMLVSATGPRSEIGRIAELVSTTRETETPLQRALARMAWSLFLFIAIFVCAIFFLGISRGETVPAMLLMAAAIFVGSVPEALPIALTVILAVGVERLARRRGIMRNLAATETLGSATLVMTDKTGTLTEADMRLVSVLTRHDLIGSAEASSDDAKNAVLAHALWGADVTIENPSDPKKEWRFSGRPFEASIARAASEHGIDVRDYIRAHQAPLLVFNSTNKFSIVAGKDALFVIGAPDILAARSKLTKDEYIAIEERIRATSAEGNRLLGVARLPHTHLKGRAEADDANNLELLGVLVFKDPLRKAAPAAVRTIESLGARVVMVTGDLKGTANAVARELGWTVEEGQMLSGEEVRQLSDEQLYASLPNIRIFARVTPEDKLRIAQLFQKRGEIVAMTGDGVNDAPSLKAVDIGVALGSGSDVAKATADLILLDDDFGTIVAAIEEGRRILENIRKVFVYLVSTCLDEVFLIGGALAFGLPLPLTALQIIWVNFFSDSLPALSFAFDRHYPLGRERKGFGGIFNAEVKFLTFGIGTISSALLFVLYWFLLADGVALEHARSMVFLCFSLYVLVAAFSLRHLRSPFYFYSPFSNLYLSGSVAFGIVLTIATVTVPFLERVFGLTTPPLSLWWIVALWLIANVVLIESAKWISVRFLSAR